MKNGNEGMSNLAEIENLNKQIYQLKKNIELVKEDAQVEHLRLTKKYAELLAINEHHQKLNGQLQEKLSKYEDKAAHYRRKGVL